jgi:hypothetical protein
VENDRRQQNDNIFSKKIRAGRRRTYFFDVRTTKAEDYYLTITESKKRQNGDGYERHKIFLYKEDFNKFLEEMTSVIDYIKERMPDFDFDSFSHRYEEDEDYNRDREARKPEVSSVKEPEPSVEQPEMLKEMPKEQTNETDEIESSLPPKIDPSINEDDLKL